MFSDSCGFPGASCGLGGSATVSEKLEEKVKIKDHLTILLTIKIILPYFIIPLCNLASRKKKSTFLNY